MLDLLLLGEVPGTSIIISFEQWMLLFSVLTPIVAVAKLRGRRKRLMREVSELRAKRQTLQTS